MDGMGILCVWVSPHPSLRASLSPGPGGSVHPKRGVWMWRHPFHTSQKDMLWVVGAGTENKQTNALGLSVLF